MKLKKTELVQLSTELPVTIEHGEVVIVLPGTLGVLRIVRTGENEGRAIYTHYVKLPKVKA